MTGGDKKGTDLSNRLKRPTKPSSRSSKAPSPSSILAPPKAAIAAGKDKKEDLQRRKNPFNEMLRSRSNKDASSSSPSTPEERQNKQELEQQHKRSTSKVSIEDIQDVRAADRIAELERALAVAREEQNAMREELEKVRQHGVLTRETIEDYRRQLSETYSTSPRPHSPRTHSTRPNSTHMDYEQTSPRRSLTKTREDLIEQNYSLRGKLAELQEQLESQESSHYQSRSDTASFRGDSEWNELTARLHNTEKESQERLHQLLSLKHSISSLTRTTSQVTDAELAERLQQLSYLIREWVISNFRRTKLDFSNVSSDTAKALEVINPRYINIDPTDRLALYQALISSALMRIFRENFIIGLPDTGPLAPIRQLAAYIHNTGSDYREWRRNTIRSLERSEARQQLQVERDNLLHKMAGEIGHRLFTLTSINLSPSAQTSLLGILNTAADLQHALLVQKAQYQVHFFRNQDDGRDVYFDEERMDAINDFDNGLDEDGDVFTERKFSFCVFPCLEKFGDEWGEKIDVRNVLLKARVCSGAG
ncbi:hypothetical protein K505DRAFT_412799 [Melanomma pulvis-pyrius CBS 109.77]|uniref:Uncharacterized protein n=1 Tax=Melanomma pulvis-pyrius CBS 109.77 TaxID=1314802 RepID=A0A6A6XW19_9PLEO|nr:hypothetical protein K505DRAFT_412799 [Melanomma pulvis-pyrius CBS 109.77]